jgi:hypothetical protein
VTGNPGALFRGGDLDSALRSREASLRGGIEPLILHEEEKDLEQAEAKSDVSGDPRRALLPGRGPFLVPAHENRISIPFTAEPDLWQLQPNTYRGTSHRAEVRRPSAGKRGAVVIVVIQPTDLPAEEIKRQVDSTCENFRF